ncbi:hypothetical protein OG357_16130 [Streptomyces sp. NBC_01255]|uniref:hypothetical protein n=1 Tax=Streptomyces sp. NBC_01255 TaxID=2903798 RepID=UPI002E3781FC|nr:hypothetical protein [Streptomyces sp. NBC_01255]
MRRSPAIPLLLVALALTGCTEEAARAPIDPIDAVYAAHTECLGKHGVKLKEKSPGVMTVDKDAIDRKVIMAAQEECKSLLPAKLPVDQEALKVSQAIAECYRRNGYPDWPDPDPETGEAPVGADMDDTAVMSKCRPGTSEVPFPASD